MNFDGSGDSKPERMHRRGHSLSSPLHVHFPQPFPDGDVASGGTEGNTSSLSDLPSEPVNISTPRFMEEDPRMSLSLRKGYAEDLRRECRGEPRKISYLKGDNFTPYRLRMPPHARRNTLADKPELDVLLRGTVKIVNDEVYFPVTATTVRILQPYVSGAKPIAETSLFTSLLLNRELNTIHAEHVVSTLRAIGPHVVRVLIVYPINTSELGNVFNREVGDVGRGSDWEHVLKCFPDLQHLALLRSAEGLVGSSDTTLEKLRQAVSARQANVVVAIRGPQKLLK